MTANLANSVGDRLEICDTDRMVVWLESCRIRLLSRSIRAWHSARLTKLSLANSLVTDCVMRLDMGLMLSWG